MTAFLVPRAGAQPDLASQPRQDPRTTAGGILARTSLAVAEAADRQAAERRASELREARISTAERLSEVRARYDADPDWNDLSARYEADAAKVRSEIAERIDPEFREDYDLTFREMSLGHTAALRTREATMRRSHERGQVDIAVSRYEELAATAPDDDARERILHLAISDLSAAVDAGWISEAEFDTQIDALTRTTSTQTVLRLLREDPGELAERLRDGEIVGLEGPERERYISIAEARVAELAATAAKLEKQEAKERDKALEAEVDVAVRALVNGLDYDEIADLQERVAGTRFEEELTAHVKARQERGDFTALTPIEQREHIDRLKAAPVANRVEIAQIEALERMHEATVESLAGDPLAHVAERGAVELPAVDFRDPASITARVAKAEAVAEEWRSGLRYLTNAERNQLAQQIESGNANAKLDVATAIVSSFGARAPLVFAEIGVKSPVFAHAGTLMAISGADRAARLILAGHEALAADKDAPQPTKKVRQSVFARTAGEAILPGAANMRDSLMEAARAHYAASGVAVDPEDEDAVAEAFERSIIEVTGGVMGDDGVWRGGLQEVNGGFAILPPGMTGRAASAVLAAATPEQIKMASLFGGAPRNGTEEVTTLDDAQLVYAGAGAYLVMVETGFGPAFLTDDSAPQGRFVLDLAALAAAAKGDMEAASAARENRTRRSGRRGVRGELRTSVWGVR